MRRKDRHISEVQLIEKIISKADVCRIGLSNDNMPYIVTMNFGYSGGDEPKLYFHCAKEGRKLEMIGRNNFVCFEMDTDHQLYSGPRACNWGMRYSSVVGYGNITVVTERTERITGLNSIMRQYGHDDEYSYDEKELERTIILRLDITEMNGKKC